MKRPLLFALLALGVVSGCTDDNQTVVPNRVLDRPMDLAMACLRNDNGDVVTAGNCASSARPSCSSDDTPQLVGFVTNSERNEIAMWRRCDVNGLVDLDPRAPGYDFVPVGVNPTAITITSDECRVVSANAGSCDLSTVFVPEVGRAALNLEPTMPPGGAVQAVIPRTSGGTPLAASPADILAVPSSLSQAGDDDDLGDPGTVIGCDINRTGSVYVTFPACQLVAEVSLTTQRVLQSRRIVTQPDGSVTVEDTGSTPLCPVECPELASGPNGETVDRDGFFPVALSLVQVDNGESEPDEADQQVTYNALFVGGTGSDTLVEIPFVGDDGDATGRWAPPAETNTLQLEQPFGIQVIRPTPPMTLETGEGADAQFLYVVAGDGSTRVVNRDFQRSGLGTECDTQVEASEAFDSICEPLVPGAPPGNSDRRPFADGPGIRLASGAAVLDWTFQKVVGAVNDGDGDGDDDGTPGDDSEDDLSAGIVPFDRAGVIGVGVTTSGVIVYVPFDQFSGSTFNGDPLNLMDVTVRPHMLWPILAPGSNDPRALPKVVDAETTRTALFDLRDTQILAPTLRRIDFAYAAPPEDPDPNNPSEQFKISERLGGIRNADALGAFEPDVEENGALYALGAPRVVARDYGEWPRGDWSLLWEGDIPGASGSTGQLICEDQSDGPYCDVGAVAEQTGRIDGLTLVDEGASFCADGVLPGDKLLIVGCTEDTDCGLGQVCLRDPTQTIGPGGVCVSEGAVEDPDDRQALLNACSAYVTDPCGLPRREYLIRESFQTRLTLWPMEIEPTSYVRERAQVPGLRPQDEVEGAEGEFVDVPGFTQDCLGDGAGSDWCTCRDLPNEESVCELEMTFSCRLPEDVSANEAVCDRDSDCEFDEGDGNYLCIDNLCRRPCERGVDDPSCFLLSPPPSEQCFREFIRYQIRARNSFVVRGPGRASFISDQVAADPDTGRCSLDGDTSSLLTSRIWLGSDEAENELVIPQCPSDRATPLDPNPCRITVPRNDQGSTRFHQMRFADRPVQAIRFSNPAVSLVLDLTSVLDIARDVPGTDDPWETRFVGFRRSRIPPGYRESFRVDVEAGYIPIATAVSVGQQPLVFPVRVMNAPEAGFIYVVDAGGRGGLTGIRGQVMRINASGTAFADQDFKVR